jgi:putative ABC transport system ATP-binding protein
MNEKQKGKFRYEEMGFIFQNYNLLESLTLYENIAAPLSMQDKKMPEMKTRIDEITTKLGINDLLQKYPHECSGGQKQRAAICRALVTNPKIIIADEPTGNLDSKNSHELLSLFKRMNEEEGIAIVMVTHDPQLASYASKLLYIKDGVIEKEIIRGTQSQKDYFYDIIGITSSDAQMFFE